MSRPYMGNIGVGRRELCDFAWSPDRQRCAIAGFPGPCRRETEVNELLILAVSRCVGEAAIGKRRAQEADQKSNHLNELRVMRGF